MSRKKVESVGKQRRDGAQSTRCARWTTWKVHDERSCGHPTDSAPEHRKRCISHSFAANELRQPGNQPVAHSQRRLGRVIARPQPRSSCSNDKGNPRHHQGAHMLDEDGRIVRRIECDRPPGRPPTQAPQRPRGPEAIRLRTGETAIAGGDDGGSSALQGTSGHAAQNSRHAPPLRHFWPREEDERMEFGASQSLGSRNLRSGSSVRDLAPHATHFAHAY